LGGGGKSRDRPLFRVSMGPTLKRTKMREREKTTSIVDVGTLYPLTKIRLDTELVFSSA